MASIVYAVEKPPIQAIANANNTQFYVGFEASEQPLLLMIKAELIDKNGSVVAEWQEGDLGKNPTDPIYYRVDPFLTDGRGVAKRDNLTDIKDFTSQAELQKVYRLTDSEVIVIIPKFNVTSDIDNYTLRLSWVTWNQNGSNTDDNIIKGFLKRAYKVIVITENTKFTYNEPYTYDVDYPVVAKGYTPIEAHWETFPAGSISKTNGYDHYYKGGHSLVNAYAHNSNGAMEPILASKDIYDIGGVGHERELETIDVEGLDAGVYAMRMSYKWCNGPSGTDHSNAYCAFRGFTPWSKTTFVYVLPSGATWTSSLQAHEASYVISDILKRTEHLDPGPEPNVPQPPKSGGGGGCDTISFGACALAMIAALYRKSK